MAELCRKCFIEIWRPPQYDIDHIVMSEDEDWCEGCDKYGKYVDHIYHEESADHEFEPGRVFTNMMELNP